MTARRFTSAMRPLVQDREKFDIQLGSGLADEDDLVRVFQEKTFEVKTERHQWEETGNIFIEYWNSRKGPSGLSVTTADYWCHTLARDDEALIHLIMPVDRLKAVCRPLFGTRRDKKIAGDGGFSKGIVLRIADIVQDFGPRCPECGSFKHPICLADQ
jgi:hypothetical protein